MVHLNKTKNIVIENNQILIRDSSKIKALIFGKSIWNYNEMENLLTMLGLQKKNIFHFNFDFTLKDYSYDIAIVDLRKESSWKKINLDKITSKVPTIVIHDFINNDLDNYIVRSGAYASLSSRELSQINFSRIIKHVIARKKYENSIFNKINVDELSGLLNLRAFNKKLDYFLKEAEFNNIRFALIYLDINNFKFINDSFGHATGDYIIRELSKRLKSCFRKRDICARLGGDEFACIIKDLKDSKNLPKIIHRINKSIELPIHHEGKTHFVSVSIGKSIYPDQAENAHRLINIADKEMYKMKDLGSSVIKAA